MHQMIDYGSDDRLCFLDAAAAGNEVNGQGVRHVGAVPTLATQATADWIASVEQMLAPDAAGQQRECATTS